MRTLLALAAAALLGACAALPERADPLSDAPEARSESVAGFVAPPSYHAALQTWRGAEEVNAWIGARFEYDRARALQLSETQRNRGSRQPIHPAAAFYDAPQGVCVDLSRFAVETLRAIDPQAKPSYVMIEFEPVSIAGQTLRRHWVVGFERDGQHYFFADSKRPGHIAGPYPSKRAFIDDYARYRGRPVVAFRELDSFERKVRAMAVRQDRASSP
ncbi:MAG: hypothetical protein ABIS28_06135 [Caldimonas sp.]